MLRQGRVKPTSVTPGAVDHEFHRRVAESVEDVASRNYGRCDERGPEAGGYDVYHDGDGGPDMGSAGVEGATARVHGEHRHPWVLEIDRRARARAVESRAVECAPDALLGATRGDADRERTGLARWRSRRSEGE
jgi:hypothetical protein